MQVSLHQAPHTRRSRCRPCEHGPFCAGSAPAPGSTLTAAGTEVAASGDSSSIPDEQWEAFIAANTAARQRYAAATAKSKAGLGSLPSKVRGAGAQPGACLAPALAPLAHAQLGMSEGDVQALLQEHAEFIAESRKPSTGGAAEGGDAESQA